MFFVFKLHLRFGGMHVHVHLAGVYPQIQSIQRVGIGFYQTFIGRRNRMVKVTGSYEATVHEKILLAAGSFRQTWRTHKTLYFNDIGLLFYWQHHLRILFSQSFHHPVFGRLDFEMIHQLTVVVVDKLHPWIGHGLS